MRTISDQAWPIPPPGSEHVTVIPHIKPIRRERLQMDPQATIETTCRLYMKSFGVMEWLRKLRNVPHTSSLHEAIACDAVNVGFFARHGSY